MHPKRSICVYIFLQASCQRKIIFWIEIVERKIKPSEVTNTESTFEKDFEYKNVALVVSMPIPIEGSGKIVIMDSGFGYVPSATPLKKKGLDSTKVFFKKGAYWPKYTKAVDTVKFMA